MRTNFAEYYENTNDINLFWLGIVSLIPILAILVLGLDFRIVLVVTGGLFLSFLLVNFYALRLLIVFFIFLFIKVFNLQISVLLVFPLVASFFISFKEIEFDRKNPLTKSFLIYFVLSLFSLINAAQLKTNLVLLLNIVAFFLFVLVLFYSIDSLKEIYLLLNVFFTFLIIHSLVVIYFGISSGERVFGFTRVYFVDLAGLGIIISLILFLGKQGIQKKLYGLICLIAAVALILTQTRNSWITVILTLLFLFFYLLKKQNRLNIPRNRVIKYFVSSILLAGLLFATLKIVSPGVEERVESLSQSSQVTNNQIALPSNSIVSRVLIWDTALLGLFEHPFIGIGVYGFPYQSKDYYKIPDYLFEIYVKGLTPHHGYLGVLTETGVIGFTGFLIFLVAIIKSALKNIRLSKSKEDIAISLAMFFAFIYVLISLGFTHAWLWGQNMMSFSFLLGLSTAQNKLLTARN